MALNDDGNGAVKGAVSNYFLRRYLLTGVVVGILFVMSAALIAVIGRDSSFADTSLLATLREEPLFWIILAAAICLVFIAGLVGQREDQMRLSNRLLRDHLNRLQREINENQGYLLHALQFSHHLAILSDLEELLDEAVDLIRSGFGVLIAQVYLADSEGQNLILGSVSGDLGGPASGRPQKLPLSRGSIVGTAAVEKRMVAFPSSSENRSATNDPASFKTWRRLAIPLTQGDQVVGVLDLHKDEDEMLGTAVIPALEIIASQLAAAIEHTRLMEAGYQARTEVEAQARRLVRRSWEEYLNAIDRPESLGFAYESKTIHSLDKPLPPVSGKGIVSVPIIVTGEPVGTIQIKGDIEHRWSREAVDLATQVAKQVGQQVESLRLLSEAEHFRSEAEKVTRHTTKENWDSYLESQESLHPGYEYKQGEVGPIIEQPGEAQSDSTAFRRPLIVQGVSIGVVELSLAEDMDEETEELVTAVTAQMSAHLENLRLADQKNLALVTTKEQTSRLALLNDLGQALAGVRTVEDALAVTAERTREIIPADNITFALFKDSEKSLEIFATLGANGLSKIADLVPAQESAIAIAIEENRVVITNGTSDDSIFENESLMVAPLRAGGSALGALNLGRSSAGGYTAQDAGFLLQVATLLATTMESLRLSAKTERNARDLALITRVAQTVSEQLDLVQLLEAVCDLINETMHPDAIYVGFFDPETQLMDYPVMYEAGNRTQHFGAKLYPESNSYKVIHSAEPILRNLSIDQTRALEMEQPPVLIGDQEGLLPASLIYVPLRTGQGTIGVFSIHSLQHNAYQDSDLALISGIANTIAIAIDNARLFKAVQSRARHEQVIRDLTERVRSTADIDEVVKTAAEEISRALGRSATVSLDSNENNMPDKPPEDT